MHIVCAKVVVLIFGYKYKIDVYTVCTVSLWMHYYCAITPVNCIIFIFLVNGIIWLFEMKGVILCLYVLCENKVLNIYMYMYMILILNNTYFDDII